MFQKDDVPVLINLPKSLDFADIYFIHDVHFGSPLFDNKKWEILKDIILGDDRAYVCFVGDLMENAIPNSKSDMFTQTHSPALHKYKIEHNTDNLKKLCVEISEFCRAIYASTENEQERQIFNAMLDKLNKR